MYQTNMYEGMLAETVALPGAHGDMINAYFARPLGPGPYPGMVLIHHMPGWDEWYREVAYKFAHHGYATLSPNLYYRAGHGTPDDVAAKVRAAGGVPDDQVVDDLAGALKYLRAQPNLNGKVGVFGTCSGGRHAYLAACRLKSFDALIDCWGGRVTWLYAAHTPKVKAGVAWYGRLVGESTQLQPKNPIDIVPMLKAPVLGLYGGQDQGIPLDTVEKMRAVLKKAGNPSEIIVYPDAPHGFFADTRPSYRKEAAEDGWKRLLAWFKKCGAA